MVWVIVFLFGLMIGSFLNVCIYRLPREQSIVWPRSRCPHCQRTIVWYDNVPVLSFALLRARCRHCGKPIHWRYPLVELLTAAAIVIILARFGLSAVGLIYAAFVCGLIAASFVDLEFQIIPDEISVGGLAAGIVLSLLVPALHGAGSPWISLQRSLLGALVGGGVLYATGAAGSVMLYGLRWLGVRLRRHPVWRRRLARYRHLRDAMGFGDVKLMAMAGAILGWQTVLMAFFLSPLLALVPGLFMMVAKRTHIIPYGPYLSLGLVIALLYGTSILRATGMDETARILGDYYLHIH